MPTTTKRSHHALLTGRKRRDSRRLSGGLSDNRSSFPKDVRRRCCATTFILQVLVVASLLVNIIVCLGYREVLHHLAATEDLEQTLSLHGTSRGLAELSHVDGGELPKKRAADKEDVDEAVQKRKLHEALEQLGARSLGHLDSHRVMEFESVLMDPHLPKEAFIAMERVALLNFQKQHQQPPPAASALQQQRQLHYQREQEEKLEGYDEEMRELMSPTPEMMQPKMQPPEVKAPQAPKRPQKKPQPLQGRRPSLRDPGAVEVGNVISGANVVLSGPPAEACKPCRAKAHGTLPTTLSTHWPMASDCEWIKQPRMFIHDHAMLISNSFPVKLAKDLCVRMGSHCIGITCHHTRAQGSECTLRATPVLHESPDSSEYSLVKVCPDYPSSVPSAALAAPSASAGSGSGSSSGSSSLRGVKFVDSPPRKQSKLQQSPDLRDAAIVVLAHDRDEDLSFCLTSLGKQMDLPLFDVFVSVDVPDDDLKMQFAVAEAAEAIGYPIELWITPPRQQLQTMQSKEQKIFSNLTSTKIANHYHAVFEKVFIEKGYAYAIFVEEDLILAPDFLALFRSTVQMLENDPSLWCVSAWNDHGFAHSFSDPCRLYRTSYFPGLGFMLSQKAWQEIRQTWPTAPTMSWDYLMRVAFVDRQKECIIPELPRSRHNSTHGSSITSAKQLRFLQSFAFANIPNSCTLSEPCNQFGDIGYLQEAIYDEFLSSAIVNAQVHHEWIPPGQPADLAAERLHVIPFLAEDFSRLAEDMGLLPKGTLGAIPQDLRSHHRGVIVAKHVATQRQVLLIERRSPLKFLPDDLREPPSPGLQVLPAEQKTSCTQTCKQANLTCSQSDLQLVNTCNAMRAHFKCEQGCAHQVGRELPAYVIDKAQPSFQQCLITWVSKLTCDAVHRSTMRLCACIPLEDVAS